MNCSPKLNVLAARIAHADVVHLFTAAFIILAAVTTAQCGDLLSNPGFESDPLGQTTPLPGWNAFGGNTYVETSPAIAHGGTNYFKVYQQFVDYVNYSGIYQDYISGSGAVYKADGWAYELSSDKLAGQNIGWIEVTFRDANANILALYRSALINTNAVASGNFPLNTWVDLPVTNQYNPATLNITNTVTQLVAPLGTFFVRYQITLQGDANYSNGSMYFDDLNLVQTGGAPYGNWNITWSDEFNGTTINNNIWTYDIGNGSGGWGNKELEYYTSRTNNAFVSGGLLHIVANLESFGGQPYTSARIKSQGLFSFLYGRLEWRARLPAGVGFWPALWLLGTNISTSIGWPGCGEIDVVENNGGNTGFVQGSLHSGSNETGYYNFFDGGSVTNFHTYTLDWTTNAILFYVDGHLYQTQTSWTSSIGETYPFPFNQPFFLIMNLAVGGNYLSVNGTNLTVAQIDAGTSFPSEMLVDYVRIYSQTNPLQISIARTNSSLLLAWPGNIVCHLQTQTNSLGATWIDALPGTSQVALNPTNNAAFFRLASP